METLFLTEQETGLKEVLQNKVSQTLSNRAKNIETVIEKVQKDNTMLNDYLVSARKLDFSINDKLSLNFEDNSFAVSDFSVGQISDKFRIPRSYMKELAFGNPWQKELARDILSRTAEYGERDRVLIREVNGHVRAFLSDSYRRYDSMEIYVAFLKAVSNQGAVLLDALSDDSKDFFEVIHPQIVPVRTELNGTVFMTFGARLRNSNFGDGALELRTYNMQAICLNGAVTESKIREIHLGKKLPEDIQLSEKTYRLDSLTKASLINDTIKNIFSPENLKHDIARIERAGSIRVDFDKEIKKLPKLGMQENEIVTLTSKLMVNAKEDGLYGEPSLWKFAQGIGAVAKEVEPARKRELDEIAGKILISN